MGLRFRGSLETRISSEGLMVKFLVESERSGVCLLVSFPDSVCVTLGARWPRSRLMAAPPFISFVPCPSPISGRWSGPHFPGENAEEPGRDSPRSSEAENLGLMLLTQALQREVAAAAVAAVLGLGQLSGGSDPASAGLLLVQCLEG